VIVVGLISEGLGSAEQVFVPPLSLNRGIALFVAIAGTLLGSVGVILSNRTRLLRVLLFAVAAGTLFGDLTASAAQGIVDTVELPTHMADM
jgi:hypothetical protein